LTFAQAYYTSSTSGLSGGKGFQFNAVSDGIGDAALSLMARLGVYAPPLTAPMHPSAEEIESFPIALLYQPLPDGRAVVAQARYVGIDYSGRWGNYFTHFLVSAEPGRDFQSVLPIELWRSPLWTTRSSSTPQVERLLALERGDGARLEDVQRFVTAAENIEHLPALITAVQQAPVNGRRVVIVGRDEEVALWIAAVTYALPRRLALQVSFCTYARSPYDVPALVVGTTADSDFRGTLFELEHQFYVFDFAGQRFSRIEPTPFAQHIARTFAHDRAESVAIFASFVDRTAPSIDSSNLASAFFGYALTTDLPWNDAIAPGDVDWVARHVSSFSADELRAFLQKLLPATPGDERLMDSVLRLHQAACSIAEGRMAETSETLVIPWLVGLFQDASTEWLVRAAGAAGHTTRTPCKFAEPLAEAIANAAEARRAIALWKLGERLGSFSLPAADLRRLGEAMATSSADNEVAALLVERIDQPGIAEGVARHLVHAMRQGVDPRRFNPMLRDARVRARITAAAEREDPAAAMPLRCIGVKPQERTALFIDAVRKNDAADVAFQLLWPTPAEAPRWDDVHAILQAAPAVLKTPAFQRCVIGLLAAEPGTIAADGVRRNVLRQIERSYPKNVRRPIDVEGLMFIVILPETAPRERVKTLIAASKTLLSRELRPAVQRHLVSAAAGVLREVQGEEPHAKVLARLLRTTPLFSEMYVHELTRALERAAEPAAYVAHLFRICLRVDEVDRDCAAHLMDVVLPSILQRWREAELFEVGQRLAGRNREQWLEWLERNRKPGALKKLFNGAVGLFRPRE